MYTVSREQFTGAVEQAGLSEDNVYEDYSGRGMYGATCVGITGTLNDLLSFVASYASFGDDWDVFTSGCASDSMGLSTIYYWPGVQLEEDDEDEAVREAVS